MPDIFRWMQIINKMWKNQTRQKRIKENKITDKNLMPNRFILKFVVDLLNFTINPYLHIVCNRHCDLT